MLGPGRQVELAGRLERLIRSQESQSRRKKNTTGLTMMLDAAVIDDALEAKPVSSTSRLRGEGNETIRLKKQLSPWTWCQTGLA